MAEEIYREWFVRMRFPGHEKVKVVKGVPEGWEVKRISEVVEFQSGYSFKSETYSPNGSYGIVTIKNVHDGLFNPICSDYVEDIPSKMKDYCNLKRGNILMSLTGNVGRVCIVYGNNLLLNQRVAKLKVSKINIEQYIYYFFRDKNVQELMINLSLGSTAQMNLSPIQLGKQKMIIPDENTLNLFHKRCSSISENILNYHILNSSIKQSRDLLLPRLISGKLDVERLDITFPPGMSNSDPAEGKEAEAA